MATSYQLVNPMVTQVVERFKPGFQLTYNKYPNSNYISCDRTKPNRATYSYFLSTWV